MSNREEPGRLMKVSEFAKALNVTEACIRKWILEKRIVVVHIGRLVRIPASECERLISEGLRPARRRSDPLGGPAPKRPT